MRNLLVTTLLLMMMLVPIGTHAQDPFQNTVPYVQGSIKGMMGMGYGSAEGVIRGGIEHNGPALLCINEFLYSPKVDKLGAGAGYSIGYRSKEYFRARKIYLGGGVEYLNLHTPSWSKSSLWVIGGAGIPVNKSWVYIDYLYPVALDQNHNQSLQVTLEIGNRRVRPVFMAGLDHYTEPSYCSSACTGRYGSVFEAGVRVMLGKKKRASHN
jgi:hypothetical protein